MKKFCGWCVPLAALWLGSGVAAVVTDSARADTLAAPTARRVEAAEAFLLAELARAGFPGASYALVAEGHVVTAAGFGLAHIGEGRAATPDTSYWVASITKSMTGLAVLALRDAGQLSLEDRVQEHLPWFSLAGGDAGASLTVRDLLLHQTGLPTNAHRVVWHDEVRIRPSMEQGARALRSVERSVERDPNFAYSNMNYTLLGLVIEAASGMPFERALETLVTGPIGMSRTAFPNGHGPPPHAETYIPRFGMLGRGPDHTGRFLAPASSGWSTAKDMGRFAEALLRRPPGGDTAPALAPLLEESQANGVPTPWEGARYGYGFNHIRRGDHEAAGHLGNASHSSALLVIPKAQVGVVLLVGGYSPARTRSIAEGTLRTLAGDHVDALTGPSDLTALLWVSRGMVLATVLSVLLLVTLLVSLLRRLRGGLPALTSMTLSRAAFLTLLAPALWWFGIDGVRQIFSDLPAPTGFGMAPMQGYPAEVAVALSVAALTASGWAAFSILTVVQGWRRRQRRTEQPEQGR